MSVAGLMEHYYGARRGWVDGTTRYVQLIRRYTRPGDRVLDVGPGCGGGFQHGRLLPDRHFVGIDPDPGVAENRYLQQARVGRAEELPFQSGSFDAAVSNYALEHLADPGASARELGRVLRGGGVFVFRTPNLYHYVALAARLLPQRLHGPLANRARGRKAEAEVFPTTYRCNTRAALKRHFGRAGFSPLRLEMIEAEPMYLQFSRLAFLLGVAYERVVNAHPLFEPFRANILGVLAKD